METFIDIERALNVIRENLSTTGTDLPESQLYDGVIVKKLVNSNSSQTHIAITSAQMDIFPYLYAENYFSTAVSKDNDLKKYFSMMVSVNIFKTNCNYLNNSFANKLDPNKQIIPFKISVIRSARVNKNTIKLNEQIELGHSNIDDDIFFDFREQIHLNDYLIILKRYESTIYDIFCIRGEDATQDLARLNNKFYHDKTTTKVYLSTQRKSADVNTNKKENIYPFTKDYISFEEWNINKNGIKKNYTYTHNGYLYGDGMNDVLCFIYDAHKNDESFVIMPDKNDYTTKSSYIGFMSSFCGYFKGVMQCLNENELNKYNIFPHDYEDVNNTLRLVPIKIHDKTYKIATNLCISEYLNNAYDIINKYDNSSNWYIGIINNVSENNNIAKSSRIPLQFNLILYGAPGTGKSHKIENEYLGKDFATSEYCRRVTFHPSYTYSQFFGTYKPVSKKDSDNKDISYEYVAGPFLDTILDAKHNREQDYVLIIEEINRANVSVVFGDAFQLLDRDEEGNSEYEITVSDELAEYAEEKGVTLINNKLGIPSNMYIVATMNSADQGVMPLDTAFKRRWDFEYIGINDGEDKIKDYTFTINNKKINWNSLRKHINSLMATAEINEDKWLGPFFISKHILDKGDFKDTFKSKVLMYLFEDSARYEMEFIIKENYQKDCKTLSGLFDSFEKHDVDIFIGSENIEVETITDGEQ